MSARDKLIERFTSLPKDFTFDELVKLLAGFGFAVRHKGKTSGSRVRFMNAQQQSIIDIHKPHTSGSPIKETALKDIYAKLIAVGVIDLK
jgi:hypothetical protein